MLGSNGRRRASSRALITAVLACAWLAACSSAAVAADPPSFAFQFGGPGTGDGQFNHTEGVAINAVSGDVYVADQRNNRVERFDASGAYLGLLGGVGAGNPEFGFPQGIAVSPSGHVFVAEYLSDRVQEFSASGAYVGQFGSSGAGNGQFLRPEGVAVDPASGDIYVVDGGNHRVQRFSATGDYLSQFGGSGSGPGQFNLPFAIAVDPADGDVYVTDANNNRVQKFDAAGNYLSRFDNGGLEFPDGVAVDPITHHVYVADGNHNRVQEFDADGTVVSQFGSAGTGEGQFDDPAFMAVAPATGNLYVADYNNSRVQVFTPPPPVCADQAASVLHNGTLLVTLSCTNPAARTQTLAIVDQPAHGTLGTVSPTSNTAATVVYTPDAGYAGPDSFTFRSAGTHVSNTATVSLTVAAGDLPRCQDGAKSLPAGGSASLTLSCSAPGDPLTLAIVDPPAHGDLGTIDQATGAVTYTPDAGFSGSDEFTFHATSSSGTSAAATFTLDVTSPPTCDAQSVAVVHNAATDITLHCNNPSALTQTLAIVGQPAHGTLSNFTPVNSTSATVRYTPALGYAGADSFTFRSAGTLQTSNTATVSLTVAPGDRPTCGDGAKDVGGGSSADLALSCSAAGDPFTIDKVDLPEHGELGTIDPVTHVVRYTPDVGYDGPDEFTFHATSGSGTSVDATYTITVTPLACDDQAALPVAHNGSLVVTLSCTDQPSGTQALEIVGDPEHGTLSEFNAGSATATVRYTPDAGYAGADSFTFHSQGTLASNTAKITLDVEPGVQPTCQAAATTLTAGGSANLVLSCVAGGDPRTIALVTGAAHGTLGPIDQATGAVTYTPTAGYSGPDQFTFRATSGSGTSAAAQYSLTVTPPLQSSPPPVIPGRDAKVKCKLTKPNLGTLKVKKCTVSFTVPTTSRVARLTLTRKGKTYAKLRKTVHGGRVVLTLHPKARLKTGKYVVTLAVTSSTGKTTRTVRRIKLR